MKQQAFGGKEKMLKGGLHCHTTRSDGKGTPEGWCVIIISTGMIFWLLRIIAFIIVRIRRLRFPLPSSRKWNLTMPLSAIEDFGVSIPCA